MFGLEEVWNFCHNRISKCLSVCQNTNCFHYWESVFRTKARNIFVFFVVKTKMLLFFPGQHTKEKFQHKLIWGNLSKMFPHINILAKIKSDSMQWWTLVARVGEKKHTTIEFSSPVFPCNYCLSLKLLLNVEYVFVTHCFGMKKP